MSLEKDEWKILEGVPDGAGRIKSQYWLGRREGIRHVLTGPRVRQLGGYSLIVKDIRNMRTWIAEIIRLSKPLPTNSVLGESRRQGDALTNDVIKGLFIAILASYGKLFPPSNGRGATLHPRIIKDPKHKKWHEELLKFRDTFAAHSGDAETERCPVVAVLIPIDEKRVITNLATELSQPNNWGADNYLEVDALLETLYSFAEGKRMELYEGLRASELNGDNLNALMELYGKSGVLARYLRANRDLGK